MKHKSVEKKAVKKRLKTVRSSAKRSRRLAFTIIIIAAMAIIATGAVITRQSLKRESNALASKPAQAAAANRNYVTVKVAGQDVQVDGQTGQIKELTPEEAQRLAGAIKRMANQSTEGLVQVQEADGSMSVDLKDRFQNVAVARVNEDGSTSEGCFDNPQAAAAFFGIDPQLIEDTNSGNTGTKQPRVTTPRN